MADNVVKLPSVARDPDTASTLRAFELFRSRTEAMVFSAHFARKRMERLPEITDKQFRSAVSRGEVVKVGPGKYNHWQVRVWIKTAGEVISLVCEVRDEYLFLITCWEGKGDESGD
jgi:hypothetical protein